MWQKSLYFKVMGRFSHLRNIFYFLALFTILFILFYNSEIIVDSRLDLCINPIETFKTYFFTWHSGLALGQDYTTMSSYIFPLGFFYYLFTSLGNIYLAQALIYSSFLFIGYYFFVRFAEAEFNNPSIGNHIGAFLYIFNLYVLTNLTASYFNLTLPYLILPAQLFFLRKILLLKNSYRSIFFFALATLFMGGINPPMIAINFIVIFVYILHITLTFKLALIPLLRRLLLSFLLCLFINMFWILGILYSWSAIPAETFNVVVLSESPLMHSDSSSFLNVFRTLGLWAFDKSHNGISYFNYHRIYQEEPLLIISMFVLPVFCLSTSLLNRNSKHRNWIYTLVILSVVMTVASHQSLFADVYIWCYENVPLFSMFRSNYKFIQVYILSLSLLLSILISELESKKTRKTVLFFSLVVISLNSFPFFTGKVFNEKAKILIPGYYHATKEYFDTKKVNSRVLLLPAQYGSVYTWGFTSGNPELLWNKGLVARQPITSKERSNKITLSLYESILTKDYVYSDYLLGSLNVTHIVQRNDFDWKYYSDISQSPQTIADALKPYEKIISFGDLDIYESPVDKFLPCLYTPNVILESAENSIDKLISSQSYGYRLAVYPHESGVTVKSNMITPIIEYKKINPTKYRVSIHKAKDAFPLIYSESFHSGWKSYIVPPVRHTISFDEADYKIIEGNEDTQANIKEIQHFIDNGYISSVGYQKNSVTHIRTQSSEEKLKAGDIYDIDFISKNFQGTIQNDNLLEGSFYDTWLIRPLRAENHIMANGYANSWIIDPDEICRGNDKCIRNPDGTYDIDLIIEYWPQRLLYIGLFVSGTTIFFCSLALILSLSKKRGAFSV